VFKDYIEGIECGCLTAKLAGLPTAEHSDFSGNWAVRERKRYSP
jgi:hypothetical protein